MGRRKGSLNINKNILKVDVNQENNMTISNELEVTEQEEIKDLKQLTELEKMKIQLEMTRMELENAQMELEIEKAHRELAKTKEVQEPKKEVKVVAHREIDADEQLIVDKMNANRVEKTELKAKIERQRAYDSQMVTGKFINRRAPGREVRLTYNKYESDPVKWYDFMDGKTYTIPRGFADQIREYYHSPQFVQKTGPMDPDNPESQVDYVDTSVKKYDFVPLSFA